jgi:hypothetical protein
VKLKFGHVAWEDDEHVITIDGELIGPTVNKRDAPAIAHWLNMAWNEALEDKLRSQLSDKETKP